MERLPRFYRRYGFKTMSIHFNEAEIKDKLENIYVVGRRLEVVFNIDSEAPIVYPTEIYRCNHDRSAILLLQTHPKVLPSFKYESMDLAVLLTKKLNRKLRIGLSCKIIKFVNDYQISDKIKKDFFLVEYAPPMRKINLRSTFRLRTSYRYIVEGNFYLDHIRYVSGRNFTIQDISVTGIGLLIPKRIGKKNNPLLNMDIGIEFEIELDLKDVGSAHKGFKITSGVEITRKMMNFNIKSGFIGARFTSLNEVEQENLFQYIKDKR